MPGPSRGTGQADQVSPDFGLSGGPIRLIQHCLGSAGPSPPLPTQKSWQSKYPFPTCSERFRSNSPTNCTGNHPAPDVFTALRLWLSASNSRVSSTHNLQSQVVTRKPCDRSRSGEMRKRLDVSVANQLLSSSAPTNPHPLGFRSSFLCRWRSRDRSQEMWQ